MTVNFCYFAGLVCWIPTLSTAKCNSLIIDYSQFN